MTKCVFFGIMLSAGAASLIVATIMGPFVIRLMRNAWDSIMGIKLSNWNPFRLIPRPVYVGAMFMGMIFLVYVNMPTEEKVKPCGPQGQAMINNAIKVAELIPLPLVNEAMAQTFENCRCVKK